MMQIKKIMRDRCRNNKGFTLIEVIAVLVIVAIISAVAISRNTATDTANLQSEINTLKAHLRYAQYLALNDISPVKWGIDVAGSSYELVKYSNTTKQSHTFLLPNESSATHSFAPISATSVTILFDDWGSPGASNIIITIGGQTITITAETGFIE